MSQFLDSRRRLIRRRGVSMTLRRQLTLTTWADVTVLGVLTGFRPEQLVGGVQQGDAQVSILNDEISAAGWPGPPRAKDAVVADATWRVQGSMVVRDGALVIGHWLWVRGGAA